MIDIKLPINEVLRVVNLHAYNAYGSYNRLELPSQKGLFHKRTEILTYCQSGIALVWTNFRPIEDPMRINEERMQAIKTSMVKSYLAEKAYDPKDTAKLARLEDEQRRFTAQLASNPSPVKLFE